MDTKQKSLVDHVIDMMQEIDRVIDEIKSSQEKDPFRIVDGCKKDLALLDSTDWSTFQFTQDTAKWIYENFSYASAVELMEFAEKNNLDSDINYFRLAEELEKDYCDELD